ncbi:hypothetical protein [Litchfieldia alkalitelluris]|uniref:hypothetical protein n=1 Tax=Litchfieldia alkalitelluris TaxID=304268 RepID=UPI0009979154|nr:hypothetical protein [Litchfieldia alkalitelluris]
MTYLIEQANVLKENKIEKCSIVVKGTNIDYISSSNKRFTFMKMNLSNYLLTPGHVMMNYTFTETTPFKEFKAVLQKDYVDKGCTTLISICDVKKEYELFDKINRKKNTLINSPIDFYIGIKIPLKLLTPSFIRACKRVKIPIVIVEIDDVSDLQQVPWGWIKEAFYPYFFPLIPKWNIKEKSFFNANNHIGLWDEIMAEHGIASINACPEEGVPLSLDLLKKMGVYPDKGDIRIRGAMDYNLYNIDDLSYSLEQKPSFDFQTFRPIITMHKGKFLKVDHQTFFSPGFGKECKVKLPGYFVSSK